MSASPFIYDVTEVDFENRVIERSLDVPVLVDFWAPWCGPCKHLGPVLESLANEYKGAFELAKVDVDQAQRLAMMLRIQSVPTVFLFKDGQPVDAFQGAQSEKQVRAFLARHVKPPEADPMEVGQAAMQAGDLDLAEQAFNQVLMNRPDHAEAGLGMARVALARGDTALAAAYLDRIPEENPAFVQARNLREAFGFSEFAGDEATLRAKLAEAPDDAEGWYGLGATLVIQGRFAEAMDAFLKVVGLDRGFMDDAGRKAVVSLFNLLGLDNPVVAAARRRLASLLF